MSDLRRAAEQALDALELEATSPPLETTASAIEALRAALAELVQNFEGEQRAINAEYHRRADALEELVQESSDTAFDRWWDDTLDGPTPIAPLSKATAQWIWNAAKAESVQQPHQIRSDFEQRMIGCGASPTALSRLESGEYLSPSIQSAWDAEKKKYTTPPHRNPLTDEQCVSIFREAFLASPDPLVKDNMTVAFARAIEQAHGIGTPFS